MLKRIAVIRRRRALDLCRSRLLIIIYAVGVTVSICSWLVCSLLKNGKIKIGRSRVMSKRAQFAFWKMFDLCGEKSEIKCHAKFWLLDFFPHQKRTQRIFDKYDLPIVELFIYLPFWVPTVPGMNCFWLWFLKKNLKHRGITTEKKVDFVNSFYSPERQ